MPFCSKCNKLFSHDAFNQTDKCVDCNNNSSSSLQSFHSSQHSNLPSSPPLIRQNAYSASSSIPPPPPLLRQTAYWSGSPSFPNYQSSVHFQHSLPPTHGQDLSTILSSFKTPSNSNSASIILPQSAPHSLQIKIECGSSTFSLFGNIVNKLQITGNLTLRDFITIIKNHVNTRTQVNVAGIHIQKCNQKLDDSNLILQLEGIGELCAFIAVMHQYPRARMIGGLDDNPKGVDQIWLMPIRSGNQRRFIIVEAKGGKGELNEKKVYSANDKAMAINGSNLVQAGGASQLDENWIFATINLAINNYFTNFFINGYLDSGKLRKLEDKYITSAHINIRDLISNLPFTKEAPDFSSLNDFIKYRIAILTYYIRESEEYNMLTVHRGIAVAEFKKNMKSHIAQNKISIKNHILKKYNDDDLSEEVSEMIMSFEEKYKYVQNFAKEFISPNFDVIRLLITNGDIQKIL